MSRIDIDPVAALKKWMIQGGGKHRKRPQIADAIGISPNRLRRALINKDNLADCAMLVLTFLQKEGVVEAERAVEDAERIVSSEAVFVPAKRLSLAKLSADDRAHIRQIRARAIDALEDETVFCQISGTSIPTHQCDMTQGTLECFGCGAPSHFCRCCQIRAIAMPGIDLCAWCLAEEQRAEDAAAEHGIPPIHPFEPVQCLIISKPILQNECRAMQSTECVGCRAPSALCVECKKRKTYYPEYGRCLACTVAFIDEPVNPARPYSDDERALLESARGTSQESDVDDPKETKEAETGHSEDTPVDAEEKASDPAPDGNEEAAPDDEHTPPPTHTIEHIDTDALMSEFETYMADQRMRRATIVQYTATARSLCDMLRTNEQWFEDLNEDMCREHVLYNREGGLRGSSDATIRLSALKKFFDWLTFRNGIELPILNFRPTDVREKQAPIETKRPRNDAATDKGNGLRRNVPPANIDIATEYRRLIGEANEHDNALLARALERALRARETNA